VIIFKYFNILLNIKKMSDSESPSTDNMITPKEQVVAPIGTDLKKIFSPSEICHYKTINNFFKKCDIREISKMIQIIDKKSKISLRILDWFVTKYSKNNNVCSSNNYNKYVDFYIEYKAILKTYKKKYFDPFRRRLNFYYCYDKKHKLYIQTTIGQLNFFKWAITFDVINYVDKHYDKIVNSMNTDNKKKKEVIKKKNKIISTPIRLQNDSDELKTIYSLENNKFVINL